MDQNTNTNNGSLNSGDVGQASNVPANSQLGGQGIGQIQTGAGVIAIAPVVPGQPVQGSMSQPTMADQQLQGAMVQPMQPGVAMFPPQTQPMLEDFVGPKKNSLKYVVIVVVVFLITAGLSYFVFKKNIFSTEANLTGFDEGTLFENVYVDVPSDGFIPGEPGDPDLLEPVPENGGDHDDLASETEKDGGLIGDEFTDSEPKTDSSEKPAKVSR